MKIKNLKRALIKFFILGFAFIGMTGLSHVSADAAGKDGRVKALSYEEYLEQIKKEEQAVEEHKKEDPANGLISIGKQEKREKDIKGNNLVEKPIVSSTRNANYQSIEWDLSSLG